MVFYSIAMNAFFVFSTAASLLQYCTYWYCTVLKGDPHRRPSVHQASTLSTAVVAPPTAIASSITAYITAPNTTSFTTTLATSTVSFRGSDVGPSVCVVLACVATRGCSYSS